jgi:AcrR family transcriptional regulator
MDKLLKKPRTKRGKETLNKILSAAAQIFYEKGYSAANVNEIATLAGIATGTFYIYFDGKYNLYRYLLLQCSHQIRKHLSVNTSACATREEAERRGFKSWLEFTLEKPYMYNIIWEALYVDRQLFWDYYKTFADAYVKGIEKAKQRGEVRDIDSEALAYTLMGATSFLGLYWGVFKESSKDLDYLTNEYMKILTNGIFTGAPPPAAPRLSKEKEKNGGIMFRVEVDEDFLDEIGGNEE